MYFILVYLDWNNIFLFNERVFDVKCSQLILLYSLVYSYQLWNYYCMYKFKISSILWISKNINIQLLSSSNHNYAINYKIHSIIL